jgi:hypothetical protein
MHDPTIMETFRSRDTKFLSLDRTVSTTVTPVTPVNIAKNKISLFYPTYLQNKESGPTTAT